MTNEYGGVINVTNVEGDGRESVIAYVTNGVVHCNGSYTDPEGSRGIVGPGLLHITLGIIPEGNVPVAPHANSRMYSVQVACPNAMYSPPQEARWSHSWDSYKQPGGEVGIDPRTKQPTLPDTLRGSYHDAYEGGGSITMSWLLCRGCQPPPPPNPPQSQP
jgi:hypothetical protein